MNAVTEYPHRSCNIVFSDEDTPLLIGIGELKTLQAVSLFPLRFGYGVDKNHSEFPDDAIRTQPVHPQTTRWMKTGMKWFRDLEFSEGATNLIDVFEFSSLQFC